MVLDDSLRDGKAQARALGFAIGKEGLEYGVLSSPGESRGRYPKLRFASMRPSPRIDHDSPVSGETASQAFRMMFDRARSRSRELYHPDDPC